MSQDEGVTQRPMQSVDDVASSNSSENAKQQRDELKTRGLDNDQSSTMGKVKNVSFDNNRKDDKKKNENKITFSTHRRSLKISARDFHGTSSSSKSEQKPVSMVPIILLFIFAIGLLLLVALVTVNDIGRNRKEGGVKQPLTTLGIKRKWKAQDAQKNRPAQIRKDSICSLHIAESSLRANVGFGLFAARHFKKGEIIVSVYVIVIAACVFLGYYCESLTNVSKRISIQSNFVWRACSFVH